MLNLDILEVDSEEAWVVYMHIQSILWMEVPRSGQVWLNNLPSLDSTQFEG